jgi:hypothetical protein
MQKGDGSQEDHQMKRKRLRTSVREERINIGSIN